MIVTNNINDLGLFESYFTLSDFHFCQNASAVYVFHDNLFVVLTTHNFILISCDGVFYRCYNTMSAFGSFVTACDFCAGTLVLGTNHGHVFAFRTKATLKFLDLNLYRPIW
jgi:hypothetical protein